MPYALAPHISHARVGGHAVVLDLVADRYFILNERFTAALAAHFASSPSADDCLHLKSLVHRGWLQQSDATGDGPVIALPPLSSALERVDWPSPLSVMEAGRNRIAAAAEIRIYGLAATVAQWRTRRLAARRRSPNSLAEHDAAAIARSYARTRVAMPIRRRCVPDSLALLRCLWDRGIDADLFFGVRLEPFAAHCWLQAAAEVLTDPLDRVAEFTAVFKL